MNSYETTARNRGKTLLIVEGHHEKNELFSVILNSFPEIKIDKNNIWVYGTNIYMLYDYITEEYGSDWAENNEDIDLPFIISKKLENIDLRYKEDYTDIILVFDYERHDPKYSVDKIEAMQRIFNDSADMGKLYINYPLIESYLYLKELPDFNYADRKIPIALQPGSKIKSLILNETCLREVFHFPYKIEDYMKRNLSIIDENIRKNLVEKVLCNSEQDLNYYENIFKDVLDETKLQEFKYQCKDWVDKIGYATAHQTYWNYMKNILKQVIVHNINKAYRIQYNEYDIQEDKYRECYEKIDFIEILRKQNAVSMDNHNGFIWVLNTCIFFVADYNFTLITE